MKCNYNIHQKINIKSFYKKRSDILRARKPYYKLHLGVFQFPLFPYMLKDQTKQNIFYSKF